MRENEQALDLYSTSQTNRREVVDYFTGELLARHVKCDYGAPLVAYIVGGAGYLSQGCCNHWDCRRCGIIRAKSEYRRIVDGCEILAQEHKLYFWTLTCRGKECSIDEAEENYLVWTNRLLTNARTRAKRASEHFAYVQVTERQKRTRAHPHSHIISTWVPSDVEETKSASGAPVLVSRWFARANATAGLGAQHTITQVRSASAVSRYVAKYLFKDSFADRFPSNWKRVRYSHNFPKAVHMEVEFSIQLSKPSDWRTLSDQAVFFTAESHDLALLAAHHTEKVRSPRKEQRW